MLQVHDLAFQYNGAPVLGAVAATVQKGRMVSVIGPNGAGKSTLIKCIAGILKPGGGQILLEGRDTADLPRRELARHIAYVPQHAPVRLGMTVFETVLAGRRPHQAWRPSRKDVQRTAAVIDCLHLADLAMHDMDQLSGGQAQKVLLARALAQEPDYLLLDEPTSNLDLRHQLEVLELIAGLVKTRHKGVFMATHDLSLAARFSHTVLMMRDGRVFCEGDPSEVIIPEHIRTVYGVEAVVHRHNGYPYVEPVNTEHRKKASKMNTQPIRPIRIVSIMWSSYLPTFLAAARELPRVDLTIFSQKEIENNADVLEHFWKKAAKADVIFFYWTTDGFWEEINARIDEVATAKTIVTTSFDPANWGRNATVDVTVCAKAYAYIAQGGQENYRRLMAFLAHQVDAGVEVAEPVPLPWQGILHLPSGRKIPRGSRPR